MDDDEERIAALIRERSLCLDCIAAQTRSDRGYVDNMLQNLDGAQRLTKAAGRCADCGRHDATFCSQPTEAA
jgi:hypothetical protein